MKNSYLELTIRQQEEVSAFPMKFAFSDEQFKQGMNDLGLNEEDTDKITIIGHNGFIKKTDKKAYEEMVKRLTNELETAISNDTTGENFIKDMFSYELGNHEFGYTRDLTDTLESLGYTEQDITSNSALKNGLDKAVREAIKWDNENN